MSMDSLNADDAVMKEATATTTTTTSSTMPTAVRIRVSDIDEDSSSLAYASLPTGHHRRISHKSAANFNTSVTPAVAAAAAVTESSPLSDVRGSMHTNPILTNHTSPTTRASTKTVAKTVATTVVNGIGLWNSWTRNFASPLTAVWDLLDNAFDAAHAHSGRLHVDVDKKNPRGMVIINTCEGSIKPVHEILEVYRSAKVDCAELIGENGVGCKQGCATLADISFVLTRNRDQYEIGFIALQLQKPEGAYLPAFALQARGNYPAMELELIHIARANPDIARVIEEYGDGSLQKGVQFLIYHYATMTEGDDWKHDHYVFSLVIYGIKHGTRAVQEANLDGSISEYGSDRLESLRQKNQEVQNSHTLVDQIGKELPLHYLHVAETFTVQVNGERLYFSYWPRRLAEMTHFKILIDKQQPFYETGDLSNVNDDDGTQQYVLSLYLGFDVLRCSEDLGSKEARLYWYSRRAGRLIKSLNDARGELKLNSGGTQFCQGLSIIVDDSGGQLPLNPTKQDLAFGEQAFGGTHRDNLIAWIGAVARIYYNHHYEEGGATKSVLTDRIRQLKSKAEKLVAENPGSRFSTKVKPISECRFTCFDGIEWTFGPKIGLRHKKKNLRITRGVDTLMTLPPPPELPTEEPKSSSVRRQQPHHSTGHASLAHLDDLPLDMALSHSPKGGGRYSRSDAQWAVSAHSAANTAFAEPAPTKKQRGRSSRKTVVDPEASRGKRRRKSGDDFDEFPREFAAAEPDGSSLIDFDDGDDYSAHERSGKNRGSINERDSKRRSKQDLSSTAASRHSVASASDVKRLSEARNDLDFCRSQLQTEQERYEDLQKQVRELHDKYQKVKKERRQLRDENSEMQKKIFELEKKALTMEFKASRSDDEVKRLREEVQRFKGGQVSQRGTASTDETLNRTSIPSKTAVTVPSTVAVAPDVNDDGSTDANIALEAAPVVVSNNSQSTVSATVRRPYLVKLEADISSESV